MLRKICVCIAFLTFMGFFACDDDLGSCDDVPRSFEISNAQLFNTRYTANGNLIAQIEEVDSTVLDSFALYLEPEILYSAVSTSKGSLLNSAYALTCVEPQIQSEKALEEVYVIAEKDYNDTYNAGDTLNAIVEYQTVYSRSWVGLPTSYPVTHEFGKSEWDIPRYFRLTEAYNEPSNSYQFSLHLHFKDGTSRIATAEEVTLK